MDMFWEPLNKTSYRPPGEKWEKQEIKLFGNKDMHLCICKSEFLPLVYLLTEWVQRCPFSIKRNAHTMIFRDEGQKGTLTSSAAQNQPLEVDLRVVWEKNHYKIRDGVCWAFCLCDKLRHQNKTISSHSLPRWSKMENRKLDTNL